jgi:hypothetical protein
MSQLFNNSNDNDNLFNYNNDFNNLYPFSPIRNENEDNKDLDKNKKDIDPIENIKDKDFRLYLILAFILTLVGVYQNQK